jgi:hypothetical protein
MIAEGPLPPEFTEPLTRALTQRGISDARIVGRRSGKQSTCFVIEGGPYHEKVVLKAMSPSRPRNTPDSVEHEYHALERLYESSRANLGVGAPEPLGLFKEQLGYLMSYVDASSVEDLLKADLLDDAEIRTVAERIVRALELYYRSVDEMCGDFHPLNVLIRPSLQVVLIDPTPTSPFQKLVGDGDRYSPMSADLGYWTYSVTVRSVKQMLKGSRLPARLYRLTSEMMACASRAYPEDESDGFSDAVYDAAGRYMARLKSQPRLRDKLLGSLAQSRLKVLRLQSRDVVLERSASSEQPQLSI